MNLSGFIKADEVRKAIMEPHGNVVVIIATMTAIVQHAQKGVRAPNASTGALWVSICRT